MRDEIHSSVGAQDMDTTRYQLSNLEDIEFHWEDPEFNMDAVFRPSIDTPFSPSTFDDFPMSLLAKNLILVDEKQDRGTLLLF